MSARRMGTWLMMVCVIGSLSWSSPEAEAGPYETLQPLQPLTIEYNGRIKPFQQAAREMLELITGIPTIRESEATERVLAIAADQSYWEDQPLIAVPNPTLRERLGLRKESGRASLTQLSTSQLLRLVLPILEKVREEEPLTALERETLAVYERFVVLRTVLDQELYLVPPAAAETEAEWLPILRPEGYSPDQQIALKRNWSHVLSALRRGDPEEFEIASRQLVRLQHNLMFEGRRVGLQARSLPFEARASTRRDVAAASLFGLTGVLLIGMGFWLKSLAHFFVHLPHLPRLW